MIVMTHRTQLLRILQHAPFFILKRKLTFCFRLRWIATMSTQTATCQGPELISEKEIGINDVLCGRGTKHCYTAGNNMCYKLVNHFIPDYARAKKVDKTVISIVIVEAVQNATPPGRFLSKHSDTKSKWKEIIDHKAREKTSQLLRETVMVGRANTKTMYQKKKIDRIIREVHNPRDKVESGSSQQTQQVRLGIFYWHHQWS